MLFGEPLYTAATTPLTTGLNQMLVVCQNTSSTLYGTLSTYVKEGTNIVMTGNANTGTADVLMGDQLTAAINQWSLTMGATANTIPLTMTYNITNSIAVTLTAPNYTGTSNLLFDTDVVTFGGLPRVQAVFTTTNTNTLYVPDAFTVRVNGRELTPEEQADREARQVEYVAQMQIEEEERKNANGKAELLLRRMLSKEQNIELDEKNYFHLWAKDGRKYRISRGWAHNVAWVDSKTGKAKETYCVHPRMQVPIPDNMLAQKLMLESDPHAFLEIAVRSLIGPIANEAGLGRLDLLI